MQHRVCKAHKTGRGNRVLVRHVLDGYVLGDALRNRALCSGGLSVCCGCARDDVFVRGVVLRSRVQPNEWQ